MKTKLIIESWRRFLKEEMEEMKKIFVLVGPPSVGKSTWINSTFSEDPYIINRDDLVEQVASEYGWTYDDMFAAPPKDAQVGDADEKYGNVVESPTWMTWQATVFDKVMEANGKVQKMFNQRVSGAVPSGQDIVIDMTNMDQRARKRALAAIEGSEQDYKKIAVVFQFKNVEEFIKRVAAKRAEAAKRMGKSKTIPHAAFKRMFDAYMEVDASEGFDEVVSVDNRPMLMRLVRKNQPKRKRGAIPPRKTFGRNRIYSPKRRE
jgi:predicted kinase